MSAQLGKRVKAAVRKAGLNYREVADQSGVPYGWVRQVAAGGIARPEVERLRAVARVVGADLNEWLALSNQLGSAGELTAPADLNALIREVTALVATLRPLAERAARESDLEDQVASLKRVVARLVERDPSADGAPSAPAPTGR